MPEICRFFKIIIYMYAREHSPPHFHASYAGHKAVFRISDGGLIEGKFPNKQRALVVAWAIVYKNELMYNWHSLVKGLNFKKIDPLK